MDGLDKRVGENLESLVDRWERFMKKEKVVPKLKNEEKDELLESDDYDDDDVGA